MAYPVVSRCLGAVLLAAAGLKLHGLAVDPIGRSGAFAAPQFQLAVIEGEILLAAWLFWGRYRLGAWVVSLTTFACFAAASFYLGWVGQASCGCAGAALSISPWYAFTFDLAVLVALLIGRPDVTLLWYQARPNVSHTFRHATFGFAGVALTSGLVLSIILGVFGSIPAAIAFFRDERVSVYPRITELGRAEVGTEREVKITLANWTGVPIHVFGGTSDCACTVLHDLPLTIPPRETRELSVRIRMADSPGAFTRQAAILVDDEGFKRITFAITGNTVP